MQTLLKTLENKILYLLLGVFILLLNLSLFFNIGTHLLYLVIFALIFVFAFFKTDVICYFLCFAIPLTIPANISANNTLNVPSELLVGILALVFISKMCFGKKIDVRFLKHPLTILLLLDLVWLFITSSTSQLPIVSFKRTFIRLAYITVYYFLFSELFSKPENIRKAFLFYAFGMIIPIISTFIYHSQYHFSSDSAPTAANPFYNDHTIYGCAIAFVIPVILFSIFHFKPIWMKMTLSLVLLLFLVAEFYSYSRAAWYSLLILPFFFLIIKFRIKFTSLAISSGLLIIGFLFFSSQILESLQKNSSISHKKDVVEHFQSVSNISSDVSNKERINRWKCAYRMFTEKPVMGFGPGTFQFYYGNYQVNTEMTYISTYQGNKGHAHNEMLNYLSETGIIGALLFIAWLFYSIYLGMKIIYKTVEKKTKALYVSVLLGLATFYFHSQFNGFIETDKMAMLVFASLAAFVRFDLNFKSSEAQ